MPTRLIKIFSAQDSKAELLEEIVRLTHRVSDLEESIVDTVHADAGNRTQDQKLIAMLQERIAELEGRNS